MRKEGIPEPIINRIIYYLNSAPEVKENGGFHLIETITGQEVIFRLKDNTIIHELK